MQLGQRNYQHSRVFGWVRLLRWHWYTCVSGVREKRLLSMRSVFEHVESCHTCAQLCSDDPAAELRNAVYLARTRTSDSVGCCNIYDLDITRIVHKYAIWMSQKIFIGSRDLQANNVYFVSNVSRSHNRTIHFDCIVWYENIWSGHFIDFDLFAQLSIAKLVCSL